METFRTLLAKAALGNGISSWPMTPWVARSWASSMTKRDLALN